MNDRNYSRRVEAGAQGRAYWPASARVGHRRDGRLSSVEKAGLLGMMAIVVIILSLVVTSGERADRSALNPDSTAAKVKRALDSRDVPESVVAVTPPLATADTARVKRADAVMGGRPWAPAESVAAPASAARPAAAGKVEPAAPAPRTYVVKKGDMLSSIARRELGRASRWEEIKKLNPKVDETKLQPGDRLLLPPR
ncbi:MAG: LysM peptidoglycan-binding domain-containing protein [Planctomycetes bacterium]|nr:LysM peptidoglycan-binding domain-containing protein [Planctomycetota bacterium]